MLRGKWISEEDMDNNYYHLKNIVRRRRKKIKALRNENRDWECDAEKLKEIVMRHFYDIFKEDQENREPIVTFFSLILLIWRIVRYIYALFHLV